MGSPVEWLATPNGAASEPQGSVVRLAGGPLTITGFTANPSSAEVLTTTYFNVTTSGGVPPLTYWYFGLPVGCLTVNISSLKCTPTAAQLYYVTVVVNDSAHASTTATVGFRSTIVYNPPPVIASYFVVPSTVPVGRPAVFNVNVTGGTGLISYFYAGLPHGCTSFNAEPLTCIPLTAGNYQVRVTISDAVGFTSNEIIPFNVTAAPGSATTSDSTLAGPGTMLAVGIGVVAVVGAALAVLVVRRRGRASPPLP